MKKILAILLALTMILSLVACGNANDDKASSSTKSSEETQQSDSEKTSKTDWPTNTIFPKPEGCTIIEVRNEDWKNYITVQWDSKEAAKNYIEIVKGVEGDTASVIGQGETEETIYYGTYKITITSMNEAENIVLYN